MGSGRGVLEPLNILNLAGAGLEESHLHRSAREASHRAPEHLSRRREIGGGSFGSFASGVWFAVVMF